MAVWAAVRAPHTPVMTQAGTSSVSENQPKEAGTQQQPHQTGSAACWDVAGEAAVSKKSNRPGSDAHGA
jgi:hypothetical protein